MPNLFLDTPRRRRKRRDEIRRTTADRVAREPLTFQPDTGHLEDRYRHEVERIVDGLLPDAIDDGVGYALDNLINAWAEEWIANLETAHAAYDVKATGALEELRTLAEVHEELHSLNQRRRDDPSAITAARDSNSDPEPW